MNFASFALYAAFMVFIVGILVYIFGRIIGKIWDSDSFREYTTLIFKVLATISVVLACAVLFLAILGDFADGFLNLFRYRPRYYYVS